MLRVTYSNSTEALIRALGACLPADPFVEAVIVVPNRAMERTVELGLARVGGLVANVRFERLERWIADALGARGRLLEPSELLGRLFALVSPEALARRGGSADLGDLERGGLEPLSRYLASAGESARALDQRRLELVPALAELFSRYARHRPDWIAAWARAEQPEALLGGPLAPLAGWQRALFAALHELGPSRLTLAELLEAPGCEVVDALPPSFLIGVSYVAPVFHAALERIAAKHEVHVLAVNPCREFWSDVAPRSQARKRIVSDSPEDPLESWLLEAWGRPGREHVGVLDELTGYQGESSFVEPVGEGALARVQRSILDRAPIVPRPSAAASAVDGSLALLPCPSLRREVETVLSMAWALVVESQRLAEEDPTHEPLHLHEIAILLPPQDRDRYLTHLEVVLEGVAPGEDGLGAIPWSGQDLRLVARSRVASAVLRLITFFRSPPTRSAVLGLVGHPLVSGGLELPEEAEWASLFDAVGIVRGIDARDFSGTYADAASGEGASLHFDQGLRRLALGCARGPAAVAESEGERPASDVLDRGAGAPELHIEGDTSAILRLVTLVRSLLADHRAIAATRLPFSRWAQLLEALAQAYVTPVGRAEEAELERVLGALRRLAAYEVEGAPAWAATEHSADLALGLAERALSEIPAIHGEPQAKGLVVASLLPLRAIPFRVVFVLGLTEGRFPARSVDRGLDLTLQPRRRGDVTKEESDRYAFLEVLATTKERLVLSYVARDEVTGDAHAPSSVISELELALGDEALLRVSPPPRRWEVFEEGTEFDEALRRFGLGSPASRAAMAAVLGDAVGEREVRQHGDAERAEFAGIRAENDAWLRLEPTDPRRSELLLPTLERAPGSRPDEARPEGRIVRVDVLRRFLACPIQGRASHFMRAAEDDEAARLDEEPLDAEEARVRWIARQALFRALTSDALGVSRGLRARGAGDDHGLPSTLRRIAARCLADERARARVPIGWLGARVGERVERELARLLRLLVGARPNVSCASAVRFGAARSAAGGLGIVADTIAGVEASEVRARLLLEPAAALAVEGRTSLFLRESIEFPPRDVLAVTSRRVCGDGEPARLARGGAELDAFLDHALLAASGEDRVGRRLLLLGEDGVHEASLPGLEREKALGWLRGIAEALVAPEDPGFFLPIEAVLAEREAIVGGHPQLARRLLDAIERQRERGPASSRRGPLHPDDVLRRDAPDLREVGALVGRRHALPLTLLQPALASVQLDPGEGLLR